MNIQAAFLANQTRELMSEGTFIANTNVMLQLDAIDWQDARKKIGNLNSIAELAFHLDYYFEGLLKGYETGVLDTHDRDSFSLKPIVSDADWKELKMRLIRNSKEFANLVEGFSEEQLNAPFIEPKYGSNRRNIQAIIEHGYYHLGQIVLIRKMLSEEKSRD